MTSSSPWPCRRRSGFPGAAHERQASTEVLLAPMRQRSPAQLGDALSDVVDRGLGERSRAERRHKTLAAGDLIAGPRGGLLVWLASARASDLNTRRTALSCGALRRARPARSTASGIARGSLAREAALRRLGPVGAPATGCVAPADLPSTAMEAGAHAFRPEVVTGARGRTNGTYRSPDNSPLNPRTEPAARYTAATSPAVRGFPSAPERTRTSTDHSVHKALNLGRGV